MGQPEQTQREPSQGRSLRTHLLVLASYTALSILMTYPLIRHFTTHFPGEGGDAYVYLWNFWYFKHQVLRLQDPFYSYYIFFPIGASLFFMEYTVVNDLAALILFFFTSNLAVVLNIILLLSFVLSGYFTFLLVDYYTHNKWAAFLAGTIFAFCPYTFAHLLGHFELTSTHWIPLFVFLFLKMSSPQGTYRQAVAAGVVAPLIMLDVYYYAVFLIFFVALFYIYQFFRPERWVYLGWRGIKKALVLVATSFLVAAPFLAMAFKYAKAGFYDPAQGWMGANDFVSDATAFFVPSFLHSFWKGNPFVQQYYFQALGPSSSQVEAVVFIGWLVTLLTLFACLYLAPRWPEVRIWRFFFLAFIILSLGPTLHVMGKYLLDFDGLQISIPLPYFLVHYIPLFNHARSPSRLVVVAMLCAGVLSAYTWIWLQERLQHHQRALVAVFVLLTSITLLEYLSVPYPLCSAQVPAVFQRIAQDKSPGTVLDLPVCIRDGVEARGYYQLEPFMMYTQTVHHKYRIGGHTGRGVRKVLDYFERFSVIRNLFEYLEDEKREKVLTPEELEEDKKSAPDLIKQFSLRYIVVHPEFKDSPAHHYVAQVFGLGEPTFQAEGYLLYQIPENAVKPQEPAAGGDRQGEERGARSEERIK